MNYLIIIFIITGFIWGINLCFAAANSELGCANGIIKTTNDVCCIAFILLIVVIFYSMPPECEVTESSVVQEETRK